MTTVAQANGAWFAYCEDRVLGPFRTERAAWRAAIRHEQEIKQA